MRQPHFSGASDAVADPFPAKIQAFVMRDASIALGKN